MALVKCRECHKEISTKADVCPHCGAPQKKKERKPIGCGTGLLILILIGFFGSQISQCNREQEERQQAIEQARVQRATEERVAKEKEAFIQDIEKHYSELTTLVDNGQLNEAQKKIGQFRKFKSVDYKDVENIGNATETKVLLDKVKILPASNIKGNLDSYKRLSALNPDVKRYRDKVAYYQKKWAKQQKEKQEREYRASCELEVLSSNWYKEYGYVTYEGQVKNIADHKLKNVQAVVTWYDKNGSMITSETALIQYNPILPGQASPFKVMGTYNPAMDKAGVEFSYLMGGTIRAYRK